MISILQAALCFLIGAVLGIVVTWHGFANEYEAKLEQYKDNIIKAVESSLDNFNHKQDKELAKEAKYFGEG